jgi:hypothetical protein
VSVNDFKGRSGFSSAERRKCLLATHEETLFTIFVPDVSREELRQLTRVFLHGLVQTAALEGRRVEAIRDPSRTVVTRTNSRSVLGSMNDRVVPRLVPSP